MLIYKQAIHFPGVYTSFIVKLVYYFFLPFCFFLECLGKLSLGIKNMILESKLWMF